MPTRYLGIVLLALVACRGSHPAPEVVSLAAAEARTCAITREGEVYCWGLSNRAELAGPSKDAKRTWNARDKADSAYFEHPVALPISGAKKLALGGEHSCALLEDGTVKCWGIGGYCELGTRTQKPGIASGLSGVVDLAAGGHYTCAIDAKKTVKCWGTIELYTDCIRAPTAVGSLADATEVAVGSRHACVRRGDGSVWCWGRNEEGTLGRGDMKFALSMDPVEVRGLRAKSIAAYRKVTCAIDLGGRVQCWGSGGGMPRKSAVPIDVGVANAKSVAVGEEAACAVLDDGSVRCWGDNRAGQLGDGTTKERTGSVVVRDSRGIAQVVLGGGWFTTYGCSLGDGKVSCWGGNDWGQLGDGTKSPRSAPAAVRW
jgi:alpha-tubulin suppressor-like RCC1 family protein